MMNKTAMTMCQCVMTSSMASGTLVQLFRINCFSRILDEAFQSDVANHFELEPEKEGVKLTSIILFKNFSKELLHFKTQLKQKL